jgi:biopolymer transport protein TolR
MAMGSLRPEGLDAEFGATPLSEINVTPLVDVMLVLLIIFMVAAPLMTVDVPVQLPKTSARKVVLSKQQVVVTIDAQGKPFLGEDPLDVNTLKQRLIALAEEDPDRAVVVRGDNTVPYGRIMEIMGQIGNAGFVKVSLVAQAPSAQAQ